LYDKHTYRLTDRQTEKEEKEEEEEEEKVEVKKKNGHFMINRGMYLW